MALRHVLRLSSRLWSQNAARPICMSSVLSKRELPNEIDFSQFETVRQDGSVKVLDVRNAEELNHLGEISGSLNVPLAEIEQAFNLRPEDFKERYGAEQPQEADDPIVVFCMKGVRAGKAQDILSRKFGFTNVSNYRGSFQEWSEKHSEK